MNDDRWHHFSIRQLVQGNLQFFFDDRLADEHSAYEISYRPNIPGPVSSCDFMFLTFILLFPIVKIYIGHFPVFSEAKVTDKPYLGCLADVVYDGFDLLKNSILTNVQMSHSCQVFISIDISCLLTKWIRLLQASASSFSFRTSDSGVKKQLFISPVSLDLNIEFRFVAPGSILRLSNINGVNLAVG